MHTRRTTKTGARAKNLTILEHLQELRKRLMICAAALVARMAASFYLADDLGAATG